MALVASSVVEQRVSSGDGGVGWRGVTEVAAEVGVSPQSVRSWVVRYVERRLAGLADQSRRPRSTPNQASPEAEARVCELRCARPMWGRSGLCVS